MENLISHTIIVTTDEALKRTIGDAVISFFEDYGIALPKEKQIPKYFTVRTLSEFTGYSVATINIKNSKGEIPGSKKIGGKVLFDSAAILEWIESGAVKTKDERLQKLERNFKNKRRT